MRTMLVALLALLASEAVSAGVKLLDIKSMLEGSETQRKVALLHMQGIMDGITAENRVFYGLSAPLVEAYAQRIEDDDDVVSEDLKKPGTVARIMRARLCFKPKLNREERDRLLVKWFYAYYQALLARGKDNPNILIRVGLATEFPCIQGDQ